MSDLTRGDDGTGYACDDPRYAGAIALLRRLADSGTGYGVDTSDLDPRPLQAVLDTLAASQERVRELEADKVEASLLLGRWLEAHPAGTDEAVAHGRITADTDEWLVAQQVADLRRLGAADCPHENVVEELHDTRRLVNGEISGDRWAEVVCTDCGKSQDHPFASEPPEWVSHILKEGSREHVVWWDANGAHCGEPMCEMNRPPPGEEGKARDE